MLNYTSISICKVYRKIVTLRNETNTMAKENLFPEAQFEDQQLKILDFFILIVFYLKNVFRVQLAKKTSY